MSTVGTSADDTQSPRDIIARVVGPKSSPDERQSAYNRLLSLPERSRRDALLTVLTEANEDFAYTAAVHLIGDPGVDEDFPRTRFLHFSDAHKEGILRALWIAQRKGTSRALEVELARAILDGSLAKLLMIYLIIPGYLGALVGLFFAIRDVEQLGWRSIGGTVGLLVSGSATPFTFYKLYSFILSAR